MALHGREGGSGRSNGPGAGQGAVPAAEVGGGVVRARGRGEGAAPAAQHAGRRHDGAHAGGHAFQHECLDCCGRDVLHVRAGRAVHRYAPASPPPPPPQQPPQPQPQPRPPLRPGSVAPPDLPLAAPRARCAVPPGKFEPASMHLPMVRVPFAQLELLEEVAETAKARERRCARPRRRRRAGRTAPRAAVRSQLLDGAQAPHVVVLSTRAHFELKLHGHSCEYPLLRSASTMRIRCTGRNCDALELLLELWRVYRLGREDDDAGRAALGAIIASREALVPPIPRPGPARRSCSRCGLAASRRSRRRRPADAVVRGDLLPALRQQPAQTGSGGDGALRQPGRQLHYCLKRHLPRPGGEVRDPGPAVRVRALLQPASRCWWSSTRTRRRSTSGAR